MDPRGRFSILWSSRDPIPRWSHEPSEIKRPRRGRIRCPNLTVELFPRDSFPSRRQAPCHKQGEGHLPEIARLGASRSFTRTATSAPDAHPRLGARGFRTFRHWTRKRESNVVPRRIPVRALERAGAETRRALEREVRRENARLTSHGHAARGGFPAASRARFTSVSLAAPDSSNVSTDVSTDVSLEDQLASPASVRPRVSPRAPSSHLHSR